MGIGQNEIGGGGVGDGCGVVFLTYRSHESARRGQTRDRNASIHINYIGTDDSPGAMSATLFFNQPCVLKATQPAAMRSNKHQLR